MEKVTLSSLLTFFTFFGFQPLFVAKLSEERKREKKKEREKERKREKKREKSERKKEKKSDKREKWRANKRIAFLEKIVYWGENMKAMKILQKTNTIEKRI